MSEIVAAKNIDSSKLSVHDFDIDSHKNEDMMFKDIYSDSHSFTIEFSGQVCTDGISVAEFGGKKVLSIGVIPSDEDIEGLVRLKTYLDKYLCDNAVDWPTTSPVRNDRIYLKILFNKFDKLRPLSNIPIDVKKLQNAKITRGQNVTCKVRAAAYFNFEEKKAGVVTHPVSFVFDK